MNKLKTINDWVYTYRDLEKFFMDSAVGKLFKDKGVEFKLSPVDDVSIPVKELQQEAIRYIKQIDRSIVHYPDMPNCPHCDYNFNDKNNSQKLAQKFILMKFFDITEEDLRNIQKDVKGDTNK
jgi:hypothetical protein